MSKMDRVMDICDRQSAPLSVPKLVVLALSMHFLVYHICISFLAALTNIP